MTGVFGVLRGRARVLVALLALLTVVVGYAVIRQPAPATHQPADKVVAAGEELVDIPAGTAVTILTATLRTAKPTDLIMSVTLECAILTKLFTAGSTSPNATSSATAFAKIDVWIQEGTTIVPISAVSAPPQDPENAGGEDDKVTFCSRDEGRQVTDAEDPRDGVDKQQTYQNTKAANAFNWVLLNAGSGIHTYQVKATLVESTPCTSSGLATEETCSDALIGNRTFVIQPVKLANDASI